MANEMKKESAGKVLSFQCGDCPSSLLGHDCVWMWCLNYCHPSKGESEEGGWRGEEEMEKTWQIPWTYWCWACCPLYLWFSCHVKQKFFLIEASLSCSFVFAVKKILRYSLSFKVKFQCYLLIKLSSVSLAEVNVSSLLCMPLHIVGYLLTTITCHHGE